jgi:CDP-diacylglycerol--serine O-phosphatidyltransferase
MTGDPGNGGPSRRSRLDLDPPPDESEAVLDEAPDDDDDGEPERPRPRMAGILILPSLITLGSTFCGFLAICYVADGLRAMSAGGIGAEARAFDLVGRAGFLIILAMVFDALDGRVARLSHVTTEFGGQLDSLSDAISFGVAPAFVMKGLVELHAPGFHPKLTLLVSVLFVICAVLRLARYNVEHDNLVSGLDYFQGLPSPGAAGVIAAIAMVSGQADYREIIGDVVPALPILTFLLAVLMVSRFPYLHAMNRFLRGRKPFTYLVLVAFVIVFSLVVSIELVVAALLLGYLLSGPIGYVHGRITGRRGADEGPLFD